mgnify:FL=1
MGLKSGFEFRDQLFMEFLDNLQAWVWDVNKINRLALFFILGGVVNFLDVGDVDILQVVFPVT